MVPLMQGIFIQVLSQCYAFWPELTLPTLPECNSILSILLLSSFLTLQGKQLGIPTQQFQHYQTHACQQKEEDYIIWIMLNCGSVWKR